MSTSRQLCVCVKNEGYEASLELRKIYEQLADQDAEAHGQVRIVDESGEDYLYPENFFLTVDLPDAIEKKLLESA